MLMAALLRTMTTMEKAVARLASRLRVAMSRLPQSMTGSELQSTAAIWRPNADRWSGRLEAAQRGATMRPPRVPVVSGRCRCQWPGPLSVAGAGVNDYP